MTPLAASRALGGSIPVPPAESMIRQEMRRTLRFIKAARSGRSQ